jgi:hypothetical protein
MKALTFEQACQRWQEWVKKEAPSKVEYTPEPHPLLSDLVGSTWHLDNDYYGDLCKVTWNGRVYVPQWVWIWVAGTVENARELQKLDQSRKHTPSPALVERMQKVLPIA